MKVFRGATAAELLVLRLDPGEDVQVSLNQAANDLSLAAAAIVSGSGTLERIVLENPATTGYPPAAYAIEKSGPAQIVAAQGLVAAGSAVVTLTLARRGEVFVGAALDGCAVLHGAEFAILRAGGTRWLYAPAGDTGVPGFEAVAPPQASPPVNLMGRPVDVSAVGLVPTALIRRHAALPVARTADTLVVAMVDPNNPFAIDDFRAATGLRIQAVAVPPHELLPAIEQLLAGRSESP